MKKLLASAFAAIISLAPTFAGADEFGTILHGKTGGTSVADTDEFYVLKGGTTPDKILGSQFLRPGGALGTPSSGNASNLTNIPAGALTGTISVNRFNSGTNADGSHFLNGLGQWAVPAGGGTVTSVALSVPGTSIFGVTGSPVTASGSLGLTTTGTSGGIPYFSSPSQISTSAALTAGAPVIGGGAGVAPGVGSRSGNTTAFVTTTGAQTSGKCVTIDANGNHIADANACGGAGASPGGSSGQLQYNNSGAFGGATLGSGLDMTGGTLSLVMVPNAQSGASYTVLTTDANKTLRMTNGSATTVNLTAAATLGANFGFYLECDAGCTIDPNASETVNGASTLVLAAHQKAEISTDGTIWRAGVLPALDPSNGANLQAATVANASLATMAAHTFKGNNTGSTAVPANLTATQLTAELNAVVGDSGSGGTKGLVPAPAAGDAAANKVLAASGAWVVPSGGGTGCNPAGSANQLVRDDGAGACSSVSGLTDNGSLLTDGHALALSGTLSPTALSGNVNDYNPTSLSTALALRLDGGAADRTITGLAGGVDGRIITVTNVGSTNKLILSNADAGSSAANRFQLSGSVELPPNTSLALRYDGTSSVWRPWSRGLANTGVTAGSYTAANITVDAAGRVTAAANGSASGGGFIGFNTTNATISTTAVYVGPSQVGTTFGVVRPWVAPQNITVKDLRCWVNGGPGAGVTILATLTQGIGGSSTSTDQTDQQAQLSGTTNGSTTAGANAGVSVTAGDVLGLHISATAGSIPSVGLSCTAKWS